VSDEEFSVGLRAFSRRRPFRHFHIEFHSGEKLEVRHPEGAARFQGVWLLQTPQGKYVIFSSSSVCRLLDLTDE